MIDKDKYMDNILYIYMYIYIIETSFYYFNDK